MRIDYIEIAGFRSYGTDSQRITFSSDLAVIHADNSQGKTSFAEAVEFLFAGTISRRQLGGGSPADFQDSLRNAHLDQEEAVYVELGLSDSDNDNDNDKVEHVLRRTLLSDYEGARDCTSLLTLDGVTVDGVRAAGLTLSDPPLQAPVLLEHSLRYAVSAKPGDRSDYFKAVVEISDLDTVRSEIAAAVVERESQASDPLAIAAASLMSEPPFALTLTLDRARSLSDVTLTLISTLNALVPPAEDEVPGPHPLRAAIARASAALASRQNSVIPLGDMQVSSGDQFSDRLESDSSVSAAAAYNRLLGTVNKTVAETIPLLKAALGVESAVSVTPGHPTDCPLCETPDALTAERVAVIRSQVADREGLTSATDKVGLALNRQVQELTTIERATKAAVPRMAAWDAQSIAAHTAAFDALGTEGVNIRSTVAAASALSAAARVVEQAVIPRLTVLSKAQQRVVSHEPIDADFAAALEATQTAVEASLTEYGTALEIARSESQRVLDDAGELLAQQTDTEGWDSLLSLARDPYNLWRAFEKKRIADAATSRLKAAQREVESAVRAVLDRKLLLMADSVRKWWSLMRPDELTAFENISRRGAGNRYLDLTATLVPDESGTGVSRNALAVLSNSQLNALGLATFLARSELLASPAVLLDDPVPGSDREHRLTFAGPVIDALLDGGRQVIIATHDAELARTIQTLHQHRGIDEFGAVLVDPRQGTRITRSGDDFEQLMLNAKSQMGSPLEENRRSAGNSLRIAAERLAKHILVDMRLKGGDTAAALSDYDNRNLAHLRPLVLEHVVKSNEPGQWQTLSRVLNNADHDAPPPQPAELRTTHDMLRDIKKSHGVSTASKPNAA